MKEKANYKNNKNKNNSKKIDLFLAFRRKAKIWLRTSLRLELSNFSKNLEPGDRIWKNWVVSGWMVKQKWDWKRINDVT